MKRFLCGILCLIILCGLCVPAFAANIENLRWQIDDFREKYDLNEENFSFYMRNTIDYTTASYNQDKLFPVGDVWRLPLNMYYYEQEFKGAYQPPANDPEWVYTIGGKTLEECRRYSILEKDIQVCEQMRDNIGDFSTFKTVMNDRFGHITSRYISDEYLTTNKYSSYFLNNCLYSVARHPEQFGDILQNFAFVQEQNGMAGYSYQFNVVHVYSKEDGMICDVGFIGTPQPYVLSVFIAEDAGGDGDRLIAELNDIICKFVEQTGSAYQGRTSIGSQSYVSSGERSDGLIINEKSFTIISNDNVDYNRMWTWVGISVGAVSLIGLGLFILIRVSRRHREFDDV